VLRVLGGVGLGGVGFVWVGWGWVGLVWVGSFAWLEGLLDY